MSSVRWYKDGAIGFPRLGVAIRAERRKGLGLGVWVDRSGYRARLCVAFFRIVAFERIEIAKEGR